MSWLAGLPRRPISWVLAAALAGAVLMSQDFGLTWDEPLFYKYADALGYAYTPANWVSGHFDLSRAYGPSGDDHKTRGPGYLLLARFPAYLLQDAGLSVPESWHLVNGVTFVLGVFFVYGLSRRLAGPLTSALGAALFATQPLLWGHAFVNPKDVPFLVFFAGAVWLGWRMVDQLILERERRLPNTLGRVILPSLFLGLATSNRVLGPMAGLLVIAYWVARSPSRHEFGWIGTYVALAATVTLATWPYLWEHPLNFIRAFGLMAQNPTVLPVLFASRVFPANELPLRYLPFFMVATLTVPVWPLCALGFVGRWLQNERTGAQRITLLLLLAWILLPLGYVLLLRPPMYDGMRHFLFILPPAFVFAAAGLDILLGQVRKTWIFAALAIAVLIPGIDGIVVLHPYEYTYYNVLTGGTGGAFRKYETDYWLTCYKDAVEAFQAVSPDAARLFVHREASVAVPYAVGHITIEDERGQRQSMRPGDFLLVNSRTNEDLRTYADATEVLSVGRQGAVFCVVKRLP
jgi:hypothetical protein